MNDSLNDALVRAAEALDDLVIEHGHALPEYERADVEAARQTIKDLAEDFACL